jgi:Gene product 88
MLKLSIGNGKIAKDTLIFSLPAGKTCPGALYCKSFAVVDANGKRTIKDGEHTEFRCFAASSEVQYDAVFYSRARNFQLVVNAMRDDSLVNLINESIQSHRTKRVSKVRIHESGDFFNHHYLDAWLEVARLNPDLKFYCYSKSLDLFMGKILPNNFYLTASYGGKFDYLIDEGFFTRYAKVFMTEDDANRAGLEVDHDESHCFYNKPFALLVHGTQPKGSAWGAAIRQRRANKQFSGYSKKTVAAV